MRSEYTMVIHAALAFLLLLLLTGCGVVSTISGGDGPEAVDVGNKAFSAEMYDTALNAYEIAQDSMPDRTEPSYNTANTLYRQQRYREAVELYDQVLAGQELDVSDWSTFNTGNALYEAGDHEQAIEMYKQALRINPDDYDAKHNLELALAHLPQPQQPEEAPDPSQEQPTPEPQQQQQQDDQEQQQQEGQQQPDQENEGEEQEGEGQPEGEPQEGEPEGEPTESENEPTEPGTGDQDLEPIVPPTGLTEEQAIRLLEMVGENAEPLRNAIQDRRSFPGSPPAQDW